MPRASQGYICNGAPLPFPSPPLFTRGDAYSTTHSEAASVRASLVTGAACMGQQHPVESSLSPNLRATPRKQRGPLKIFASSEPTLSYKLTGIWEQATAPAARASRNFPRSQVLGATFWERPANLRTKKALAAYCSIPTPTTCPELPGHRRLAPARTRRCLYQKFCCGRLHRSLLGLYRPQSAVSCSTLRERAA